MFCELTMKYIMENVYFFLQICLNVLYSGPCLPTLSSSDDDSFDSSQSNYV